MSLPCTKEQEIEELKETMQNTIAGFSAKLESYENVQKQNSDDIRQIREDVAVIVQLKNDIEGAARIGSGVQKILTGVVKLGFIGTFFVFIFDWLNTNVFKIFK